MHRLLIPDPCLTTALSHNYGHANALVREARVLQLPIRVFCHLDADRVVRQIPAQPFFRQLGYGYMVDSRPAADFMAISYSNRSTLKDLQRLTAIVTRGDFVLFPTVTCNIVLAICQWINGLDRDSIPHLGMCLMFPPDINTAGHVSSIALDTYQKAFSLIPRDLADRIVYICEFRKLSQVYESIVGIRPLTQPIQTFGTAWSPRRHDRSETQISFLGGGRVEKGFHLLPEVIANVRLQHPNVRFLVQVAGYERHFIDSVASKLKPLGDGVRLIQKTMSDGELCTAIEESSLVLLPYDATRYKERGSSIYTEAKRFGVPMVLPCGTVFGEEAIRKGIGESFDAFTAESVSAATSRAVSRLESLLQVARQEAALVRGSDQGYLATLLRRSGYSI